VPPPLIPPGAPAAPDWRKQAFDFLGDSTKQLITVATGVVTATVLFSKDLDTTSRDWALAAWVVLTLSVIFGIFTLFNMSGNLNKAAIGTYTAPNLTAGDIRFFSACQIVSFLLGVVLVIAFGFFAVRIPPQPDPKPITVNCVVQQPPPPAKEPETKPQDGTKEQSGKKQVKKIKQQ
jgi:di/tricarboxylate transporter